MGNLVELLMMEAKQILEDRRCAEFGPAGGNPHANIEDSLSYKAAAEIKRLSAWVEDLQSGMYVNCVYCGHRYGPQEDTPTSMAEVLKEHILECPDHPLSQMRRELEAARKLCRIAAGSIDCRCDMCGLLIEKLKTEGEKKT